MAAALTHAWPERLKSRVPHLFTAVEPTSTGALTVAGSMLSSWADFLIVMG